MMNAEGDKQEKQGFNTRQDVGSSPLLNQPAKFYGEEGCETAPQQQAKTAISFEQADEW